MNLFILDWNPKKIAEYHCDKHIIKMPLESAQMLSTVHRLLDNDVPDYLYKITHKHHPVVKWTMESWDNYDFHAEVFWELLKEFERRRGKMHACEKLWPYLRNKPKNIPNKHMTPFAQAMSEQYRNEDAVGAYRSYYLNEKQSIAKWANGEPYWWHKK